MKKVLKKTCAGMLAAVILFLAQPYQTTHASDLDGHWAETVLREWSDEAFIIGYDDGNFYPDANITRAEFMTMVNRMEGYTEESEEIARYTDVPKSAWHYRTVSRAIQAGYIKGVTDTRMAPAQYITRQEAVAVVNRLAGIAAEETETDVLKQVMDREEISSWAREQMAAAILQGFLTGAEGKIEPLKNISRAEAVVLLNRIYQDSRTLSFSGAYNLGTVKNVVIATAAVTLSDTVITKDLDISVKGEGGEVTLNNVQVQGRLILRGKNIKLIQDQNTKIAELVRRAAEYKDGTYIGLGIGYGGDLSVTVTIEDGAIISVVVNEHHETPQFLKKIQKVFDDILSEQVSEVDIVSGATRSSKAIIAAVEDALAQARGETTEPGQTEGSQISHQGSSKRGQVATKPQKIDYFGYVIENGVYEGSANGYGGTLSVQVTVENHQITAVEISQHNETGSYLSAARRVIEPLLKNQSTAVDTISGATKSSYAILSAVEDALKDHASKRAALLPEEDLALLRAAGALGEDEIIVAIQLPQAYGAYTFTVSGETGEELEKEVSTAASDNKIVSLKTSKDAKSLIVTNRITAAQLFVLDLENGTFGVPAKQGIETWTTSYDETLGSWFVSAKLLSGKADDYRFKVDGIAVVPTGEEGDPLTLKIPVTEGTHKLITAYNRDVSERLSAYTIVYQDGYSSTGDDEDRVPAVSPATVADGTYEGSGAGFGGPIHVTVTVADGRITQINAGANHETLAYVWESIVIMFINVWNTMTDNIIANNTTQSVDTISGATYTCNGIKDAVNDALGKGVIE